MKNLSDDQLEGDGEIMKKTLLVTLADKNYIDQAKQLFSSVYHNAGWKGDYMLLSHDIPESKLRWFREKGILVKRCKALYNKDVGGMPPTVASKFYLFTPEFKQWDNIVFLDADIIARYSIDRLVNLNGLCVTKDIFAVDSLQFQIIKPKQTETRNIAINDFSEAKKSLEVEYNLRERSFCSGVLAFSTDIIEEDTFRKLCNLTERYGDISTFGEQLILNLVFYRKWKRLPNIYNAYFPNKRIMIEPDVILLHSIVGNKPWSETNRFYGEWKRNLKKAEKIQFRKRPPGNKMGKKKTSFNNFRLEIIYNMWHAQQKIAQYRYPIIRYRCKISAGCRECEMKYRRAMSSFGLVLKRHSPELYKHIKKIKDGIHDAIIR